MKKLIFLSMFGLLSVGAFASNEEETSKFRSSTGEMESTVKSAQIKTDATVLRAEIIVNCEDGSSYTVSCDSCTTSQLIGIAWALCD